MRTLAAILLTLSSVQALAHSTHCAKTEKTVFSCLVGKKVISICASQDLSPTTGYMQFRLGKIGAPELLVPKLDEHPLKYVDAEAYQAASGQNGSITFVNGENAYTVHWESYRSDHAAPNGSSVWLGESGLSTSRNRKMMSDVKCGKATSGDVLTVEPSYLYSQVGYTRK